MPSYFVCTAGPMGGCLIVFVGDEESCVEFIFQCKEPDDYYLYKQIPVTMRR